MVAKFRKIIAQVSTGSAAVSGGAIILLMLVATATGISRKLGEPIPNAVEMSESLLLTAVFLGLAYTALHRRHVTVDLVTMWLPPRPTAVFDAIVAAVSAILFGAFTWSASTVAIYYTRAQEYKLAIFDWPIWPFRIVLVLGLLLLTVQLISIAIEEAQKVAGRN